MGIIRNVGAPTQPLGMRQIMGVGASRLSGTKRKTIEPTPSLGTDSLSLGKQPASGVLQHPDVVAGLKYLSRIGGDVEKYKSLIRAADVGFRREVQRSKDTLREQLESGVDLDTAFERASALRNQADRYLEHDIREAMSSVLDDLVQARRQSQPVQRGIVAQSQVRTGIVGQALALVQTGIAETMRAGGDFFQEAQAVASQGGILGLGQYVAGQAVGAIQAGAAAIGKAAARIFKKLWPW